MTSEETLAKKIDQILKFYKEILPNLIGVFDISISHISDKTHVNVRFRPTGPITPPLGLISQGSDSAESAIDKILEKIKYATK
ncbi:hypothetical protein LCGC14_0469800 [marine sediment metagenome]|uniref:YcaO domain-containing protein n=1 Tax=marine sediment metagenome TaxID=412755 RepID=A0A0F9SCN5_9ZZZZ